MGSGLVSPSHLAILLVIVLIVFGPKRLPELGRALGSGMRGFKDAISGDDDPPQIEHGPPPAATTVAPTYASDERAAAPAAAAPEPPADGGHDPTRGTTEAQAAGSQAESGSTS